MHKPRKKTYDARIMLVQEAHTFLQPEIDAPPGAWRRVQVIIPESPEVFIGIDRTPEEIGLNRNYKMPRYAPGAQIELSLLPEQFLTGMSGTGFAVVSIIVEHFGGE